MGGGGHHHHGHHGHHGGGGWAGPGWGGGPWWGQYPQTEIVYVADCPRDPLDPSQCAKQATYRPVGAFDLATPHLAILAGAGILAYLLLRPKRKRRR